MIWLSRMVSGVLRPLRRPPRTGQLLWGDLRRLTPVSRQFGFSPWRVDPYLKHVPVDVEVWVLLPGGKLEAPLRDHGDLPISWNQMQLRIYALNEAPKRYGTIENAKTGDVQGNLFALKVEKCGICRGETRSWDELGHVVAGSSRNPSFVPCTLGTPMRIYLAVIGITSSGDEPAPPPDSGFLTARCAQPQQPDHHDRCREAFSFSEVETSLSSYKSLICLL